MEKRFSADDDFRQPHDPSRQTACASAPADKHRQKLQNAVVYNTVATDRSVIWSARGISSRWMISNTGGSLRPDALDLRPSLWTTSTTWPASPSAWILPPTFG